MAPDDQVLKAVFRYLHGESLARSMLVCKQWRRIALDDDLWRRLRAISWPSICKRHPSHSFYRMYSFWGSFGRGKRIYPAPKLSLNDLELYLDIWRSDDRSLMFSRMIVGYILKLNGWIFPIEPKLTILRPDSVIVSLIVKRKDSDKFATLINKSVSKNVYNRVFVAFDKIDVSETHPSMPDFRPWISLLFTDAQEMIHVTGIQFGFDDVPISNPEIDYDPSNYCRKDSWAPHEKYVFGRGVDVELLWDILEWKQ